jgi:hypothetical protein
MILWYARWVYLNSDISQENERYLMNFQYLNGIVSKPHQTFIQIMIRKISSNTAIAILLGIVFLSLILYLIKKITFFLLLNTIFIMFIVILALFFSFRSVKRDWQNQVGFFLKHKKYD